MYEAVVVRWANEVKKTEETDSSALLEGLHFGGKLRRHFPTAWLAAPRPHRTPMHAPRAQYMHRLHIHPSIRFPRAFGSFPGRYPAEMFEARLKQGATLKKILEAVKDLVTESNWDCSR